MRKYWLLAIGFCALLAGYLLYPKQVVEQQVLESANKLKPGIYRVEYDQPDFRGWKAFFVMQINSSGEIEQITYDYVDLSGGLKTQDLKYNKIMRMQTGIGPKDYCPRFAKNLLVYQNPAEVDSITGATHSSQSFREFAQAAFKNAEIGEQATFYISQPEPVSARDKE